MESRPAAHHPAAPARPAARLAAARRWLARERAKGRGGKVKGPPFYGGIEPREEIAVERGSVNCSVGWLVWIGLQGYPFASTPFMPQTQAQVFDFSERKKRLGDRTEVCVPNLCWRLTMTEGPLTAALSWLARHQDSDGGWSADFFSRHCQGKPCSGAGNPDFDEGLTSLALLALLQAGHSPKFLRAAQPCFGEVVKDGLRWLIRQQEADGGIGNHGSKPLMNHVLATEALVEGYGQWSTESMRSAAQKAVDYLVAARTPGAGWRYVPRSGDSDSMMTGWAVHALVMASKVELTVPPDAIWGADGWLMRMGIGGANPGLAYARKGTDKVLFPEGGERFADHPASRAMRSLYGRVTRSYPNALAAEEPAWFPGRSDFFYWYLAAEALAKTEPPRETLWLLWIDPLKAMLLEHQARDGCEKGSWDPAVDRWGSEGGRVYATAINAMSLEVSSILRLHYRWQSLWR